MKGAVLDRPTAPGKPKSWAPPGFDTAAPCEIRFITPPHGCREAASWGFKLSCCGLVKLVCQKHWEHLNGGGVNENHGLGCIRCHATFADFKEACAASWRI